MEITTEVRAIIKKAILQMRQDNTDLSNQIKNIFNNLQKAQQDQSIKKYHASRFSFVNKGSYFTVNLRTAENKGKIKDLYERMLKVFYTVQKRLNKQQKEINYAIYFRDSDGKLNRLAIDHIPNQATRGGNSALKTSGLENKIKNSQNKTLYQININEHFESYLGALNATYKGSSLPSKRINMGHLTEAFERHFQAIDAAVPQDGKFHEDPPWNFYEIWRQVRESKGNTPWFQAGDVNNTQVKFLGSGDIRLSSYDTLEDLLGFFNYLLDPNLAVDQKMIDNACKIFIEKELTDEAIDRRLKGSVYKDISKHVKQAQKQGLITLGH